MYDVLDIIFGAVPKDEFVYIAPIKCDYIFTFYTIATGMYVCSQL